MKNFPNKIPEAIPSDESSAQQETDPKDLARTYPKRRVRNGVILAIAGYLVFLLGVRPGLFNLDRSRVIGFAQISVFLAGLGIMVLGSYITLTSFWPQGEKTIAADIGSRLMSTGFVVCFFTAMADIFGLGSHSLPDVFFGPLQANGMAIGMVTIALGFLLLIRYERQEISQPPSDETTIRRDIKGQRS